MSQKTKSQINNDIKRAIIDTIGGISNDIGLSDKKRDEYIEKYTNETFRVKMEKNDKDIKFDKDVKLPKNSKVDSPNLSKNKKTNSLSRKQYFEVLNMLKEKISKNNSHLLKIDIHRMAIEMYAKNKQEITNTFLNGDIATESEQYNKAIEVNVEKVEKVEVKEVEVKEVEEVEVEKVEVKEVEKVEVKEVEEVEVKVEEVEVKVEKVEVKVEEVEKVEVDEDVEVEEDILDEIDEEDEDEENEEDEDEYDIIQYMGKTLYVNEDGEAYKDIGNEQYTKVGMWDYDSNKLVKS